MKGKSKLVICLLAIFLGYFGIDKFYYNGLNTKSLIWALLRLLSTVLIVTLIIWIVIDVYQVLANNRYKLSPFDY